MTAAQRTQSIANPAAGLLVYQTDTPAGYYYYTGSAWTRLINDPPIARVLHLLPSNAPMYYVMPTDPGVTQTLANAVFYVPANSNLTIYLICPVLSANSVDLLSVTYSGGTTSAASTPLASVFLPGNNTTQTLSYSTGSNGVYMTLRLWTNAVSIPIFTGMTISN